MKKPILISIALLAVPSLALAQGYDPPPAPEEPAYEYSSVDYESDISEYYDDFGNANLGSYDSQAPDRDFVWVDGQILQDNSESPGFYRLRSRPGMVWMDGHYDASSRWIEAGWRPTSQRRGQVWVAGRRGDDGFWIDGQWRESSRPNQRWIEPRRVGNSWSAGHWQPVTSQPGQEWTPGFWTDSGTWIEGFWRPTTRAGFTWTAGSWRYGVWTPGHWKPTQTRPNEIWSPGHVESNRWVEGTWQPQKSGFVWVAGSYASNGRWVNGHWERGRAKSPKRRFQIYKVKDITKSRAQARRVWKQGGVTRVDPRGIRMERRGKRIDGRKRVEQHVNERNKRVEQRRRPSPRKSRKERRR